MRKVYIPAMQTKRIKTYRPGLLSAIMSPRPEGGKGAIGMMAFFLFLLTLLAAMPLKGGHAASEGPWSDSEQASVRLISAVSGTGQLAGLPLGLEFQMQPGWKIYWRTPGDAGLPPVPHWDGSVNVGDVSMEWPLPHRFSIFGLDTFGYSDEAVFPLTVKPVVEGQAMSLRGTVDYLICAEICVPQTAKVSIDLPSGAAEPTRYAHKINQYKSKVPGEVAPDGLRVEALGVVDGPENPALRVAVSAGAPLDNLDLFVEGPSSSWFGKPEVDKSPDGKTALLNLKVAGVQPDVLRKSMLVLTLTNGDEAIEVMKKPDAVVPLTFSTEMAEGFSGGLLVILAVAFLGGVILNVMPCVLPVLSIKIMSVLSHGGADRKGIRLSFIASAAGIISSFLLLAAVLSALKVGGSSIGWGIQFQQPVFLAGMVAILALFTGNMLGFYEIALPGRIGGRAAEVGHSGSLTGHFLTGALATLLATPCSAPFVGTAVGFALSRGPLEIVLVFLAMGLGLALPFILVAVAPGFVRKLPKPGQWMRYVKLVLAAALIGTAIWLLSVLEAQIGPQSAFTVAVLAVLVLAVLAVRRVEGARLAKYAVPVALLLAVATALAPLRADYSPVPASDNKDKQASDDAIDWIDFDEAGIADMVRDGRTVFVDVTADWCITCQYNKTTVVETDETERLFNTVDMVAMKADWTRPDPVIAKYLAKYGRYGIPFNIVYGPGAPEGIILPELLDRDSLEDAVMKASSKTADLQ